MKRALFPLLLLAMLPALAFADPVDAARAQRAAKTFMNNNGVNATRFTDLSAEAGFPNLYVFNAEKGFVVMAADDRVQPVLGYSLTECFVVDGMPDNLRAWLQGYDDEIQAAIDSHAKAAPEAARQWFDLDNGVKGPRASVVVDPLLSTQWDQGSPYNMYCPKVGSTTTVTGCVATAMAQVMKYWDWPTTGVGSHEYTWNNQTLSADFGSTTYNWSVMTDKVSSGSSSETKTAVATLMYHCGVAVEMDYGTSASGGSGAYGGYAPDAFINYFRYAPSATYKSKDAYTDEQWKAMLKFELEESRPVFYCGSYESGGHAFVCDGYRSDDYFHFNWGWSGSKDGYFAIGSLNPGSGGSGSGQGTYNLYNSIMVYAEPLSDLAAPTLAAVSQDDNVVLTWNAVEGATSYDVYKDNVKVATGVTNLQYVDQQLPFGVYYEYYVRAVNGTTRSNMSNVINFCSDYRMFAPTNLTLDYSAGTANLSWNGYEGQAATDLHYGIDCDGAGYGSTEVTGWYWGQRFPAGMLASYEGMQIAKVSFYAAAKVQYKVYVFKTLPNDDNNKLCEQTFTVSSTGWNEVVLSQPVTLDVTQDLWVILYTDGYSYPATFGSYSGTGVEDAQYLSDRLSDFHECALGYDISWAMRTYLVEGTYTYRLYDNSSVVADGLTATTYSIANVANDMAHQYTVKIAYSGNESSPSNMQGLTLGAGSLETLALDENDKMTVAANSTLTVTGALTNTAPEQLIFESGAQLVNNSTGVQATVKKDITAYTDEGGWYTIATPFVAYDPANTLATDAYDLYAYDEDGDADGKEWVNYKAGAFNLTPGNGYLYAHNPGANLAMTGTLNSGNYSQSVPLSYANASASIKGFNLLGNPTPHDIGFTKTDAVADGYYYLADGDTWTYTTATTVPAGRGFLVKAEATGQSVTLNPQSKGDRGEKGQYLCLAIGDDNAYLKLDEGVSMPLLDLKGRHSGLYFTQGHKSYVMLVRDGADSVDLSYEPHDGTQTLTVTLNSQFSIVNSQFSIDFVECFAFLNYLHLIDNKTGADIDLLATPSYTFESHSSDYPSRFRLVFSASEDGPSTGLGTFAYYDGNVWNINNPSTGSGSATLQVIDVTGRQLFSTEINSSFCIPHSAFNTAGIYMLRLINGDSVRTQKIAVR